MNPFRSRESKRAERAEADARQSFQQEAMVHADALYESARYMTRGGSEAEDLVQETLLKAFRSWDRYQPGTNCKAWLFRIMTNTFINSLRKRRPLAGLLDEVDSSERAFDAYGASEFYESPAKQAEGRMVPERVQRAIESMPENFRVPVILADLQDFSYKEIGEILDCPVGTVMSRLHRGRKLLQEQLFEHAVDVGVIPRERAALEDGTLSLEAYRQRRKSGTNR